MNKFFRVVLFVVVIGGIVASVVLIVNAESSRGYTATCRFSRLSDTTVTSSNPDDLDMVLSSYQRIRSPLQFKIKGDPALRQLIRDIDELHRDLPVTDDDVLTVAGQIRHEERMEHLRAAIVVTEEIATDSMDMVRVEVTLKDGHLAADIANTLVETYLKNVRTSLDNTLIQQKKFFATEATRYRRKLSELESKRLRFANNRNIAGLDIFAVLKNPEIIQRFVTERPQEVRDKRYEVTNKIKYLTEMFADRPIGDRAAIQIVEWKVELELLNRELEKLEAQKSKLEVFNRRFFEVRNEWQKILKETEDATRQFEFWNEKLDKSQVALTMAVSERGMRLNIVERAKGPPGEK